MRDAVETYFQAMHDGRSIGAGTRETSYYPALSNLLDAVGHGLKPRVRVVIHPRNTGAGIPDGGFYTIDQKAAFESDRPLDVLRPSRGVLEVKSPSDDVEEIAKSTQIQTYVEHYGQVLVTNFRDFLLVDRDHHGNIRESERLILVDSEKAFWDETIAPKRFANRVGDQLVEYLHRVMIRQVSLTQPRDVAMLLASYARDMKARLEYQDLDDLAPLREALESTLGITFEGEDGTHFFQSTLVQTLFYGMFSAWVLQNRGIGRGQRSGSFDWRVAGWSLKVPAIQSLFHEFTRPESVERLGLHHVLDWTGEMLNRIDAEQFLSKFSEGHAVQYFYEPFLEAFDPELRKQLGVWYTPHEIVTYMVERVDRVLREELDVARGLADPNVYVLDPCTGTGSYLVGVLRRIHQTLQEEGSGALVGEDLKRAVKERLFGFELLPAPFIVAHLQMGLALQELDAPLNGGANERPAILLTNALTGWDVVSEERYSQSRASSLLAALDRERNRAGEIKREKPILVIIGNPPYNGYAGIAIAEERELSDAYRVAKRTKKPQGQGLNDLYVRFFRMAERRIVEQTGRGVVCYISNYSWLDGLSFTAMRERFLDVFDQIWIDNLHGDRIISEYSPDGRTSETVFALQGKSPGIKVGTAISTLVARERASEPQAVTYYRDVDNARASERTAALLASLKTDNFTDQYEQLEPSTELGLPFKPRVMSADYLTWPLLPELFPTFFPGVKTSRDDVIVDIDQDRLIARMELYFDPARSDAEIERLIPGAMESSKRFNATQVRTTLAKRGFLPDQIVRYAYRPFDVRWLYWELETKLLDEKRRDYLPHLSISNIWLSAGQRNRKANFYQPQVATSLADHHIVESNAGLFPQHVFRPALTQTGQVSAGQIDPNLSTIAHVYVVRSCAQVDQPFFHTVAFLHAPQYRTGNAGALRQDWPRIPLPADGDVLASSAALGQRLAALLDIEQDVPGISSGSSRPELRQIAVLTKIGGGNVDSGTGDLAVNVGWGHGGNGKPIMPSRGRLIERILTGDERVSIEQSGQVDPLGMQTVDVYLNDTVYWRNVPERVWDYSLGGYQVLKKWLSYREAPVLGRDLEPDEVRTFTQIARRIAAILLLELELDANYERVAANTWDWQSAVAREREAKVKGIGPQQDSLF